MTNPTGFPLVSDSEFNEEQKKSDATFDQEFGGDRPGTDTVIVEVDDDKYIVTGTPEEIDIAVGHLSGSDSLPSLFDL